MKNKISQGQREEITALITKMRKIAGSVGPLHPWWDIIFDMEAFLKGERTIMKFTAKGWIDYAKGVIDKSDH